MLLNVNNLEERKVHFGSDAESGEDLLEVPEEYEANGSHLTQINRSKLALRAQMENFTERLSSQKGTDESTFLLENLGDPKAFLIRSSEDRLK